MLLLSSIPVVIWGVLLFARGGFWRTTKNRAPRPLPPAPRKHVAVVIPARNEAEHIGATVSALAQQDFAGTIDIFVVDDNSTDGTASAAKVSNEVVVLNGKPLPPGWTGKLWALFQGIEEAAKRNPEFFLLTDADITHDPNSVSELVSLAESCRLDLASFMVKLRCETLAEMLLIPAFVFFFFMLYPPAWIQDPRRKTAGAAGGCVLIRPEALSHAGGITVIRDQVIDDCALARIIKQSGGRVWLGVTDTRRSERSYETFGEVGLMISRTAFNQLNHSTILLALTIAGLCITYVAPVALLFTRRWKLGLAAYGMMTIAYLPTVRFYKKPWPLALTLPLTAIFYATATVHSAIQYWTGRGGAWKGRIQDVPKLSPRTPVSR